MRASVINRIAKISASAARRADTAWVRRLAATVPLAAVVAVVAVGAGPVKGDGTAPAAAAKPAGLPSAAIPGAGAPVAPTASPSPTAPTASAAPTTGTDANTPAAHTPTGHSKAPAVPAAAAQSTAPSATGPAAKNELSAGVPGQDAVAIRFNGLGLGPNQGLPVGAMKPTAFSVTWTNTSGHRLDAVAPVVAAQHYAHARCQGTSMAQGSLQRQDASGWTDLPLSQGLGTDYVYSGDDAAFALEPGASRTIDYRVGLGADNGPGTLLLEADAFLPVSKQSHPLLGGTTDEVTVSDDHRPTASMPTMTPHPTSVKVGGPAVEVEVSPGNFTKEQMGWLAPRLTFNDAAGELRAQDVTAEVMVNGAWKQLPVRQDCDGVSVDASSVATIPAPAGRVFNYDFRFALKASTAKGITSLTVGAGAVGDAHYAAPVTIPVAVVR
ncbi:hypothetical protein P3T35_000089 [Kitasatospora sp. GP30]|uniref:hypothetical protein n=1 Tax=Kitasatospora sp. GP30 TaxID=3035084 RepID=UPI000C7013BD|nr:hypothetical protein [Kitasatospora sp. GP30]MDH6138112.1 hypothetical protein [Kitasatospora sp. GP30]